MTVVIGSLCSGVGGLELGVSALVDCKVAYTAEVDPLADRVLRHRFPVPNLGDLRGLDTLPSCDMIVSGFPCQPASTAGKRRGVDDERWVWPDIVRLLGSMEPPRWLFFENVQGLRTVNGGEAMARVISDLHLLGYVGRWGSVRASDVGACHRRRRIFIHAWKGEPLPTDGYVRMTDLPAPSRLLPTPTVADSRNSRNITSRGPKGRKGHASWTLSDVAHAGRWGEFDDAIRRHAEVLGRLPPDPMEDGKLGAGFVEWMMMVPNGWVTDIVDKRTLCLRLLGNAVVPVQAAFALGQLARP